MYEIFFANFCIIILSKVLVHQNLTSLKSLKTLKTLKTQNLKKI